MARISVSAVWDRTTEFIGDRTGAVLAVAAPAILAALVAQQIAQRVLADAPVASAIAGLALQIPLLWAQLQVMALAIDPAVAPAEALQRATNRLPAALLLWLAMFMVAVAAMVPLGVLLAASGVPFERIVALGPEADPAAIAALIPKSAAPFLLTAILYLFAAGIALLILFLRWAVVYVVALVEAVALPALGRSWRLTRGMTLALIGVALLYGLVATVAALAAQTVVGAVLGLIFGRGGELGVASLGGGIAAAIVATAMAIVAAAFLAKFYLAQRRLEDGLRG